MSAPRRQIAAALAVLTLALGAGVSGAADGGQGADDLALAPLAGFPPVSQARQALMAHPDVRAAEALLGADQARQARLQAGPYETELVLGRSQRRELTEPRRYAEGEIGLQRTLRLPGKADLDRQLGDTLVSRGQSAYGDALHETARALLAGWFELQRGQLEVAEMEAQSATWKNQWQLTRRRVELGDAAALEADLSEAQWAQAEARLSGARERLAQANNRFRRDFPQASAPAADAVPDPALRLPEDVWLNRILRHDHALAQARFESAEARLEARRAGAERVPDPRIGLRWASERDGQEKLVGVQLTIPLPGSGRAADERGAQARATAAEAREAALLARVRAEAQRTVQWVGASGRQWQYLETAAQRLTRNANLLEKAWRLGEGSLGDLIAARRQAGEARLAAAQARAEAHEARYRLALDAHVFWSFDEDDEAHEQESDESDPSETAPPRR